MLKTTIKREKLMIISNISVMTITFIVLGVFISVVAISQTALRSLEKQAPVTVYFKDDFPEEDIKTLQNKLNDDERVLSTRYVSKEEAYAIFTEINKDDPVLLESVTPTILPVSLEIRTKSLEQLPQVAGELSQIDGVEDVKYFKDVIERFQRWSTIAYTVGFSLVAILLLISVSVIVLTLRLMITAKGKELEILKLVGASNSYVKNPLLKQGAFLGIASGLLAGIVLILVAIVLQFAEIYTGIIELGYFPDFSLSLTVFAILLSLCLVVIGFTLGYFGSLLAIKKYLKY